jgi:hyperosmotically inducible periplasmic protein
MRMRLLGALAIAITSTVGVSVAAADDNRAENRIESRLHHDAKLKSHDLKVDVDSDGVATLKGKVSTEAEKLRAERLAHVAGVTRVENKIEIDTGAIKDRIEDNAKATKKRIDERADKAKDRVDDQEDRAKARVDEAAKESKERAEHRSDMERGTTPRYEEKGKAEVERPGTARKPDTVGEEMSDSWITTKVKTQFVGVDTLKGSDISVDTNQNGVVTLTGTIPNEAARAKAVEIARTTKGVRRVVDELKLSAR